MRTSFQDAIYRPGSSALHRLDPRVKLPLVLAWVVVVSALPAGAWPALVFAAAISLALDTLSELSWNFILRRSLVSLPFILAAVPLAWTGPQPFATLPLFGQISLPGLERLAAITLKAWVSIQAMIVLAGTTPQEDLLVALRGLHIPPLLVMVIGLMWRYLALLVDEAGRLILARKARSTSFADSTPQPGGTLRWRAGVTGSMVGSLFVRSLERSERVHQAMLSRGFDGEIRSLPAPSLSARNRRLLYAGLAGLALFWLAAALMGGG